MDMALVIQNHPKLPVTEKRRNKTKYLTWNSVRLQLNRGSIADLPSGIHQKSRVSSFWQVVDSFVLLAYASLAASRTFLQRLLACVNFTLDSEDLSFRYKQKKWFQWTMAAAQTAENHGDKGGLTSYFWWAISRSILTWTHSQNSRAAAEVLRLNIVPCISQMITKTNQQENSHKQWDKTGYPVVNMIKVNGNWDNNRIRIFQRRESHCGTNTRIRRKK